MVCWGIGSQTLEVQTQMHNYCQSLGYAIVVVVVVGDVDHLLFLDSLFESAAGGSIDGLD